MNVRSYLPDSPRSQEFVYGLTTVDDAVSALGRLAADGLFVIANETVDVTDGGVSGVAEGNVIEFAPDDTPRCVEKPGVASLPSKMALSIIEKAQSSGIHTMPGSSLVFIRSCGAGRALILLSGNLRRLWESLRVRRWPGPIV